MKILKLNYQKQILTLLIAIISISLSAQDTATNRQKGNILLSGGALVHYTMNKFNNNKNTSFTTNITPKAGYFIMNNMVAGLEFTVNTSKETLDGLFGEREIISNGFAIAPFTRYYLKNGFFAEGLVGLGWKKNSSGNIIIIEGESNSIKTNTFGFRVGAGYAINLGEHVAIEPSINYSWERDKRADVPSTTSKNTLSSIFLGVNFTVFL